MTKICRNCINEIPDDAVFCTHCGKKVENGKKNNNKRLNIIIIVIAIIFVFACIGSISSDSDELGSMIDEATGTEQKEKEESKKDEEESYTLRLRKKFSESEFKSQSKEIPYKNLSRNPEDYEGQFIHFKGKIIQVLEDTKEETIELRIDTKLSEYQYAENDYYDDTIYVIIDIYDKNNRILEDDIIDIWGMYGGITSYTTVLGAEVTLPYLLGVYWNII